MNDRPDREEYPGNIGEEKLLTILESMDEVIYVADPDTYELLYLNPPAIRHWGDRTGDKCHVVLQNREEPCPFCTNPLIFGENATLPYIWTFKNQVNNRWYKCTDRTITWSDGRLVRFEMAVDITDRVQAEEALRESDERYRIMVESSLDAIYLESFDGEILDCNRAACDMLCYSKDELLGMKTSDLIPKDKLDILPQILNDLMTSGKSFVEGENIRKDGVSIPVESWARVIDTSSGRRVVVYVRDITERKNAQMELVESEKRFRSFMDQLPAAVFLKDADSRYVYINPFMRDVFAADDSWIGSHTSQCFSEDEADSLTRDDREALDRHYSINIQRVVDSNGRKRVFQTHKFRISKGRDNGDMLGGIALDITDKVIAEETRKNLEAQIQHTQKLESLGVLAGGIAHDFNNILMAILGYADLALLDSEPGSPSRSSIEEIEKAARNAADLTKQMLAYSGKGKFQIAKLDLNKIIREMTHLLEISISKKAVIKFNLAAKLPPIEADPSQIRQIIMNLITNASDSMEDTSGVITITTNIMDCDSDYLGTVYLSDRVEEGTYVYMEVADTGCGMDDQTLKRLFDPFFTAKFTGRGLGLSAVLGIIRGHGGTIKVYSEEGSGSSFKVLLPAVKGEAESGARKDVCRLEEFRGGTVLLVDDEVSVREVGMSMLERKGYDVLVAGDGREALEIFREKHDEIDCIILDLTMPHMDGDETFREMRKIDSSVKVIISSGYNKQDVTQRFVGKGLAGFIQKPYRLSELHAKVQEVINRE
ncbi:MAG: PAS domain S-box protein [Candidatus Fermentibacteraceae bacterium]|nr:PAS domain S-box protein [Candidatus Fermentibacteraceae bacterium]